MSQGEKVLDVNVFQSMQKGGDFKLDKDIESWMKAELRQKANNFSTSADGVITPRIISEGRYRTNDDDSLPLLEMLPTEESKILQTIIPKVGSWDLDILGEYQTLQCRPLFYVVMGAVHRDGILDLFVNLRTKIEGSSNSGSGSNHPKIPIKEKFVSFLTALESKYDSRNPYHNNCHAADVVNSMVCLLNDGKSEKEMTIFQRMSSLIAAAAHDVGHTGQNNSFHTKYLTKYALQYSDHSVMEMHHSATT